MNDPGHMGRRYLWQTGKARRRVHIENLGTDRTFCQTENGGGKPLDGRGTEVPAGRRLCRNCTDLEERDESSYAEPDVRVLMGERIAEVEPELFASTVVPAPERTDFTVRGPGQSYGRKKWKRAKQARPAHRPRARKPKRSTAKYARPFDDDLPW